MTETLIQTKEVRGIMTKSNLPVGGYSVNPYVGCTHGCRYCYASFMKRFTGHKEEWGTFLDVKHWPAIVNPKKYAGQRVVIGSVTDGYNPEEAKYRRTRKLLEELKDSDAEILICTKSDLVLRDLDLLRQVKKVTVSWSVNTLDEPFPYRHGQGREHRATPRSHAKVLRGGHPNHLLCVAHLPWNHRFQGYFS